MDCRGARRQGAGTALVLGLTFAGASVFAACSAVPLASSLDAFALARVLAPLAERRVPPRQALYRVLLARGPLRVTLRAALRVEEPDRVSLAFADASGSAVADWWIAGDDAVLVDHRARRWWRGKTTQVPPDAVIAAPLAGGTWVAIMARRLPASAQATGGWHSRRGLEIHARDPAGPLGPLMARPADLKGPPLVARFDDAGALRELAWYAETRDIPSVGNGAGEPLALVSYSSGDQGESNGPIRGDGENGSNDLPERFSIVLQNPPIRTRFSKITEEALAVSIAAPVVPESYEPF